jgi:Uma2 family endonuclease
MKFADLDLSKTYSYADYYQWSFEERLELIKGKIFKMSPGPASNHQKISITVSAEIYIFLKNTRKTCSVFAAPFDVRLPRKNEKDDKKIFNVLQPDICVICDLEKVDARGCIGAPDIVVEILSPGNNKKELRNKYDVYEEAGVKEYWIISPQDFTFQQYTLFDSKFKPSRLFTVGDIITTPILPGFELDLEMVFTKIG